jgi:nucleoside-specific outer membrane channel protein Tsx
MKKILLCVLLICSTTYAADFSFTNIQFLTGKDYSKGGISQDNSKKNIITFEHVSSWKYGDNFFFLDLTNPTSNNASDRQEMYGEWHPRISLPKLRGKKCSGFLQNLSLAAELNFGRSSFGSNRAVLYGIGIDLKVPGFAFFNINFFARQNKDSGVNTFQISPYWLLPFTIGGISWEFNGFLDYETSKDSREANYLFSPQLLLDLGQFWGDAKRIHVGLEYNKWHNMFGIKDNNEDRWQLMARWTL